MCKSSSRTQCHCCQKNFCRTHFIEHDNLPNVQLNAFVDEINLLNDRLAAFNVDQMVGDSRRQLERWRINCHKIIDDIFEEKCHEIDQRANEKIEKQRDGISKMRSLVAELLRKQETTMKDIDLLKVNIHTVIEKLNNMEQTCIGVVVRPLVINDNLIRIEELYAPQLDLSILLPPYKTTSHVGGSSVTIASNDQFFLIHQQPNLCLMDRELTVVKMSEWNHGLIRDMCWSWTLARFFVLAQTKIFTVDENAMSVEVIQINQDQKWWSGTCSDTSLFLSTLHGGSSIWKFSLFPSIRFEKQWSSAETCAENQIITNIVYKNEMLALTLMDGRKEEKLIELRSSITLERLWSLRLDLEYDACLFGFCFLNHGDWLVWNSNPSCILHITKDGKLLATSGYNTHPGSVCLFDGNKLIVSTDKSINCHELNSKK
jgi:hypothetical protein